MPSGRIIFNSKRLPFFSRIPSEPAFQPSFPKGSLPFRVNGISSSFVGHVVFCASVAGQQGYVSHKQALCSQPLCQWHNSVPGGWSYPVTAHFSGLVQHRIPAGWFGNQVNIRICLQIARKVSRHGVDHIRLAALQSETRAEASPT